MKKIVSLSLVWFIMVACVSCGSNEKTGEYGNYEIIGEWRSDDKKEVNKYFDTDYVSLIFREDGTFQTNWYSMNKYDHYSFDGSILTLLKSDNLTVTYEVEFLNQDSMKIIRSGNKNAYTYFTR